MSDESKKAQDSINDEIESSEESSSIENNRKPKLAGSIYLKPHDFSKVDEQGDLTFNPLNEHKFQTVGETFQNIEETGQTPMTFSISKKLSDSLKNSPNFLKPPLHDLDDKYKQISPWMNEDRKKYINPFLNQSHNIHANPFYTDALTEFAEKEKFKKEKEALVKEKEALIKEKEVVDSEALHFEALSKIHEENIKEIQNEKENLLNEQERLLSENKSLNRQHITNSEHIQMLITEKNELTVEKKNLITEKVNVEIEIDKLQSLKSDLIHRSEIAVSAKKFMNDEIKIRRLRRDSYQNIAHAWSVGAAFLIILGLGLFYDQYNLLNVNYILKEGVSIPVLTSTYLLLKAGFFISAFGIAIRFCMVFRDKVMLEASKENEKIDSMSYGKFYIDTYAETSTREQVTEALSGWNKSNSTTSKDNTKEAEPPLNQDLLAPQNLKSISDLIQGLMKGDEKDKKPDDKLKEKAE